MKTMATVKQSEMWDGELARGKSKLTGNPVILVDAEEQGLDPDGGGKYALICDKHGGIIQDTNKARLRGWLNYPEEWCEDCRDEHTGRPETHWAAVEQVHIPNGTMIEVGDWNGIVVDTKGNDVQITSPRTQAYGEYYLIPRDRIKNRKVTAALPDGVLP